MFCRCSRPVDFEYSSSVNPLGRNELKPSHIRLILCLAVFVCAVPACYAQNPSYRKTLEQSAKQQRISDAQVSQSFQQYIAAGKLQLSLDDAIRLALANNTDIAVDQQQIGTAKNAI